MSLSQPSAQLTWTPSETGISEVDSYSIYRGVNGATPTLLITCKVRRDFLGGIISVDNCTTTPSVPTNDTKSGSVYSKVTNEDAPITYIDANLQNGLYAYYVVATPMGNNQFVAQGPPSSPSNTVTVAIGSPATSPTLSTSLIGSSEIDLSWTASTVSGSTIANYFVFRQVGAGLFAKIATVAGNVLTYHDVGLLPSTKYTYYVIAHPADFIDSAPSNHSSQTTPSGGGGGGGGNIVSTFTITVGTISCNNGAIGIDAACHGLVPLTGHPSKQDFLPVSGGALVSGDTTNKIYAVGISATAGNGFFIGFVGTHVQADVVSLSWVGSDSVLHTLNIPGGNFLVQTATDPGDLSLVYTFYNWFGTDYPGFASMNIGSTLTFTLTANFAV